MDKYKENYYVKRLQKVRMNIMRKHPFYAILLLKKKIVIDEFAITAYTDGEIIGFPPSFLEDCSDEMLEIILLHEVLHIVLNHCNRLIDGCDFDLFNIACDIVVNSNIFYSYTKLNPNDKCLKLKDNFMHLTPGKEEGYLYNVDEVYKMLCIQNDQTKKSLRDKDNNNKEEDLSLTIKDLLDSDSDYEDESEGGDDHSYWQNDGDKEIELSNKQTLIDAYNITCKEGNNESLISPKLEKLIKDYISPKLNWRIILENFIQREVNDYSFSPPDRRYHLGGIILPDFNENIDIIDNIWFCVDTSGSVSDDDLKAALSEIKGAIDQFDGHIKAYISYFDTEISEPVMFDNLNNFNQIKIMGGGGTSFDIIFDNMTKFFNDLPTCVVILTDGYSDYPNITKTRNVPVLWLINNEEKTPPWGKIARFL